MRQRSPFAELLLVLSFLMFTAHAQSSLDTIDSIVNPAVDNHVFPGAVVVIGHDGKVVFRRAYGMRSLEPAREPMTADTVFDMASLTKPTITALAVMQLS